MGEIDGDVIVEGKKGELEQDLSYVTNRIVAIRMVNGIFAKKQFCSKLQVGVRVKLFQWFEVDNFLPVLNAGRFASAILGFQISRAPPCLFLQSLMGNYDVIARLDVLKYSIARV